MEGRKKMSYERECPVCHGAGSVPSDEPIIGGSIETARWEECDACDGDGVVEVEH